MKRPVIIFGSDGIDGAQAAVRLLTDIFASEAMLGYCASISVTQNNENVIVTCDDRGLYLGQDHPESDEAWKTLFSDLYPGLQSGPAEEEYRFSFFEYDHGLYFGEKRSMPDRFLPDTSGVNDLCLLQCVCEEMRVTVVKDGLCSELHFHCGYNQGGIRHSPSSRKNGTEIRFRLNPKVFSQTVLSPDFYIGLLQDYAMLIPGLHTHYYNAAAESHTSFCFPDGIPEFVRLQAEDSYAPVYENSLSAIGKDRYNQREYQASVKAAICFVPYGASAACYHNLRLLKNGGTHFRELKSLVCDEINVAFRDYITEITGNPEGNIQPVELDMHIVLMVETRCSRFASQWENGTRQSIRNVMIKDMTHDIFSRDFVNYLYQHKKQLQPMIDTILASRIK